MISVRSASSIGGNGVSSVILTKPTGVVAGDLLVLVAHNDPDGSASSITSPAGFTRLTGFSESIADYDNAGGKGKIWYRVATSGDVSASNYTVGVDSNTSSVVEMLCVTGQALTNPFNAGPTFSTNPTTDSTHVAPSVTPSVNDALLICGASAFSNSGARTYTPPSGMTEQTDQQADPTDFLWASTASLVLSGGSGTPTGTKAFTPSASTSKDANTFSLAIAPETGAPTANAGPDQTVNAGVLVTLDGTGSSDSDGTITGYQWSQTSGTAVTLSSTTVSQPTFTSPADINGQTLVFSLVVTDNDSNVSAPDTVTITVRKAPSRRVWMGTAWELIPRKVWNGTSWGP